jgi:hypothetical protein
MRVPARFLLSEKIVYAKRASLNLYNRWGEIVSKKNPRWQHLSMLNGSFYEERVIAP